MAWTRKPPTDGSTHWSTRTLAKALQLSSHTFVQRAWQRAGLQPHRWERYMRSTDPDFETKAADVLGLYLDPPQHAAVFCLDEKTAIQALDRRDPVLPLSPGRAERHGFEYHRHGTLSLYAALNTRPGEGIGQTAARHTSEDFLAFLAQVVDAQPRRREVHIILDNLATHKTQKVRTFLAAHPRVQLHFTPTYSSWLNHVELWFAKIERDVLARAFSPPSRTCVARSSGISAATTRRRHPCAGPMRTRHAASRSCSTSVVYGPLVTAFPIGHRSQVVWQPKSDVDPQVFMKAFTSAASSALAGERPTKIRQVRRLKSDRPARWRASVRRGLLVGAPPTAGSAPG